MNELFPLHQDNLWIPAVIALSFLAGCVYRLCSTLSQPPRNETGDDSKFTHLNQRFDRELRHVRQLHNELIEVRQAVESRAQVREPTQPAEELEIDPFKLARSGASIKILMSRCRLSRAEAELLFSVHGAGAGHQAPAAKSPSKLRSSSPAPRHALTA